MASDNDARKAAARGAGVAHVRQLARAEVVKKQARELRTMQARHKRELALHDLDTARLVAAATVPLVHGPRPDGSGQGNACGNRGAQTAYLAKITCPECRAVLVDAGLLRPTISGLPPK